MSQENKTRNSIDILMDQAALVYEIISKPGNTKASYRWALYAGLYLIFATLITLPSLFFEKGALIRFFSEFHHPALSLLLKYSTYFGNGTCFVLIGLGMTWYKRSYFLPFIMTGILHLIFILIGKYLFPELSRPLYHLSASLLPPLTDGMHLYTQRSFPSGHVSTVLSWATLTYLLIPKRRLLFPFFMIVPLVCLSRIYFLQAFYEDVVAGALIGVAAGLIGWIGYKVKHSPDISHDLK